MKKNNDVVAGLGEIGTPLKKIFSKDLEVLGYDTNQKLMTVKERKFVESVDVRFLHICIPFNKNFIKSVKNLIKKFKPKCIIIHSTVEPNTTKKIQNNSDIPIIYSPIRGVHRRMQNDLKRYTKYFAIEKNAPKLRWATKNYSDLLKKCGVKTKRMSSPVTLELGKIICDTSYYGWLITYAQLSNIIAKDHNVKYDEMWEFAEEIHKYLGNRPKMFPGIIGGHCVIPNLDLIHNQTLDLIKKTNDIYTKRKKKF